MPLLLSGRVRWDGCRAEIGLWRQYMPICKRLNSINIVKNNYANRRGGNVKSTGLGVMVGVSGIDGAQCAPYGYFDPGMNWCVGVMIPDKVGHLRSAPYGYSDQR